MKCIKCMTVNISKAKYCKNCKYEFSDSERKIARGKTLIGKIETLEKAYKMSTLQTITGHILFKISGLLLVLGLGLYFWYVNGIDVKLLKSDSYFIEYNTYENEYYLVTEYDETVLNLYIPNRTEGIKVSHYNERDELLNVENKNLKDEIVLEAKDRDYYILTANYLDNKEKSMKLYILKSR